MSPAAERTLANAVEREVEGQSVAVAAQPADDASGDVREIGMPAERFARVDVRKVHFDEWNGHRRQGVAQGDAGVGVAARVDDDEGHPFTSGGLDAVDQIAFVVALEGDQFDRGRLGLAGEGRIDVRQRLMPIDIRFALAEQIQVRAMQNQDAALFFVNRGRLGADRKSVV